MKGICSAVALLCTASLAAGFATAPISQTARRVDFPTSAVAPFDLSRSRELIVAKAAKDGADGSDSDDSPGFLSGIKINPPYAVAYVLFLGYAYVRTGAEVEGASFEVLNQYIADPLNPGFNELFITVFNLLGLYVAPIACLLMPGAKNQKLPATPFILGSMFGGYGAVGPYAFTRTPDPSPVTRADLGWFTANVLENKLFNYFILAAFTSAYITSGALASFISDPGQLIQGYGDMFSETAIVSASSMDFLILTISAASFIPEDLSRRGYEGELDPKVIAALTAVLPGVGVALYCALRPALDEE